MRAILTYHSIDDSGSPISVAPDAFRRHVAWLASGAVRGGVMTLDALARADDSVDAVAITFDDGFANLATEAAPLLRERGLPATVFVVTDQAGGTNAWGGREQPGIPTLPLLGWDTLGKLSGSNGPFTIGSHTKTHRRLTELDRAAIADELRQSADRIRQELGASPKWLAYPYGDVPQDIERGPGSLYEGAVTTEHRLLGSTEQPLRMPRLDMFYYQDEAGLTGWGSPWFRRAIWLRRQARKARAAFGRITGPRERRTA